MADCKCMFTHAAFELKVLLQAIVYVLGCERRASLCGWIIMWCYVTSNYFIPEWLTTISKTNLIFSPNATLYSSYHFWYASSACTLNKTSWICTMFLCNEADWKIEGYLLSPRLSGQPSNSGLLFESCLPAKPTDDSFIEEDRERVSANLIPRLSYMRHNPSICLCRPFVPVLSAFSDAIRSSSSFNPAQDHFTHIVQRHE